MHKRKLIPLLLMVASWGFAHAQQLPEGIDVDVNAEINAFELNKVDKSDVDMRREAGRDVGQQLRLPFGGANWYNNTGISFSYAGLYFGGKLSLDVTTSDKQYYDEDKREWFDMYPVHAGAMNVWFRPLNDMFKVSMGRGIGSGYADAQGGEGMRIYSGADQDTWDKSRNPDDPSQDEGLLLETFFGPVSLALAGRYYSSQLFTKNLFTSGPQAYLKYASMEQQNFSYGARVGYQINDFGKINASWIVEYDNKTGDNYTDNRDGVFVPISGEAELTRHLFGLFASLYPFAKFGVSLSYNAIYTQYPEQVYDGQEMVNITLPGLYQQALNLSLRYEGIKGLMLRTDHNISFWEDKNFKIYKFPSLEDAGIVAETAITLGYPMVGHLLIWNGMGVGYELSDAWKLELYLRNLYRRDTATDTEKNIEYRFTRNRIYGELKGFWRPIENLEVYFGVIVENTLTLLSEDVAKETVNIRDGFMVQENAREIKDTVLSLKVPVGITVRIR